jgi:hypothetical protein
MASQTETTTQVARKVHRCTWCWQGILVGESYARYRYFDGGDSGVVKMHEVMLEKASEEGGFIEWTPGMERPAKRVEQADNAPAGGV